MVRSIPQRLRLFLAVNAKELNRADVLVLLVLESHRNKLGYSWPSQVGIAGLTGLSKSTVNRALNRLESMGAFDRIPPFTPGHRRSYGRNTAYRMYPSYGEDYE